MLNRCMKLKTQARSLHRLASAGFRSPAAGSQRAEVSCIDTSINIALRGAMKDLSTPYPGFFDPFQDRGHVETVWGSLVRRLPAIPYRREPIRAQDGGTICLDWHVPQQPLPSDAPVMVLVAGLTGGSETRYTRHATLAAAARGYRVVVYNHCGVAGTLVTSPRLYCALYTHDLRDALVHVSTLHPGATLVCCAWSIGANVLVHLLAEEAAPAGRRAPLLTAAASLCNPFDLPMGHHNWTRQDAGFRRAYDHYLAGRMRKVFQANYQVLAAPSQRPVPAEHLHEAALPPGRLRRWPSTVKPQLAAQAQTVRQFDEAATIHWFGFDDVDEYYEAASSARVLHQVDTPVLCVQAADDPIAPAEAIPTDAFNANPHLMLVTTPAGGHLGWVGGAGGLFGQPWTDELVLDYMDAALGLARQGLIACNAAQQVTAQAL